MATHILRYRITFESVAAGSVAVSTTGKAGSKTSASTCLLDWAYIHRTGIWQLSNRSLALKSYHGKHCIFRKAVGLQAMHTLFVCELSQAVLCFPLSLSRMKHRTLWNVIILVQQFTWNVGTYVPQLNSAFSVWWMILYFADWKQNNHLNLLIHHSRYDDEVDPMFPTPPLFACHNRRSYPKFLFKSSQPHVCYTTVDMVKSTHPFSLLTT